MASAGNPKVDKVIEDQATKTVKQGVAWLLKKALLKNGVPKLMAGPLSHYYDEHIKIFIRVVKSQLDCKPEESNLKRNQQQVDKYVQTINEIRWATDVPDVVQIKRWFSTAPFLGPEALAEAKKQHAELVTHIEQVIGSLDVQLDQVAATIATSELSIDHARKFLRMDKKDPLEIVLGNGSIATAQNDLCVAARDLLSAGRRLEQHRNEWAALVDWPKRQLKENIDRWETKCGIPF